MDSIINKLRKILNIREMYILLIIVLVVLFISISSSLAIFSETTEKLGIAEVIASDVTQVLSSQEERYSITTDRHSGTITVGSKSKAVFDITVKNEHEINTKYKMYYQFSNNIKIIDVDVGISTQSIDESAGVIKSNEEKKVRIVIKNKSDQDANIIVGVQGGYENNEVELYENRTGLEKIPEGWT